MNITSYIVEFLKKGNDVEIPEVGVLKLKTISAQYHENTGEFTPAIKTIVFEENFTGDKKIVDYIAAKECVSPETAAKMWFNYVEALKEKLQKEGEHPFENIGVLKHNSSGEHSFTVNEDVNLFENNFGLYSLKGIKKIETAPLETNPFDYTLPSQNQSSDSFNVNKSNQSPSFDSDDYIDNAVSIKQKLEEIVKKLDEPIKKEDLKTADDQYDVSTETELNLNEEQPQPEESVIQQEADNELESISQQEIEPANQLQPEEEVPYQQDVAADQATDPVLAEEENKPESEEDNQANEQAVKTDPQPETEEQKTDTAKKEEPKEKIKKTKVKAPKQKRENETKSNKGKIVVVVFFSILIIGAGLYQYRSTHNKPVSQTEQITNTIPSNKQVKEVRIKREGLSSTIYFFGKQRAGVDAAILAKENKQICFINGFCNMHPVSKETAEQYWIQHIGLIGDKNQPKYIVEPKPVIESKPSRRNYTPQIINQPKAGFDLVAGLFKVKSNALKQADFVAQKGLNPHIIEVKRNGENYYYVSLGYRESYTEIEMLMKNYKYIKDIEMVISRW